MNETLEFAVRAVLIGAGATLVMDAWAALLRRFGVPSLEPAMLGRWVGHLGRGRLRHASIARAEPVRGERALGWASHYAIGVTFAALLLVAFGTAWARSPSLLPALAVGAAGVVAPWFILQPAIGAGVLSLKTASPGFNAMKSLVTHVVFGFGLYGAGLATAALLGGRS